MSSVNINYYGRLGNHILMYMMGQYLAEKFNLKFDLKINDPFLYDHFNISLFCGNKNHTNTFEVTDENVTDVLKKNELNFNLLLNGFFQSVDVLGNVDIQNKYKTYINPKETHHACDLYVHVRLGDITNRHSLPLEYYKNTLKRINYSNGIISSDSPNHPIINQLCNEFGLKRLVTTPAQTIQIGSSCKNLLLSAGTFSFLSAFFSVNSNVFYIDNPTMKKYFQIDPWGPDIFSIFKNKYNFFSYGE